MIFLSTKKDIKHKMSTTHKIMSKIDEIKQKMSTQDYLDLCNLLKKKSEEENEEDIWNKLFVVKYFKQYVQLKKDDYDDSVYNELIHKNESIVCKFKKDCCSSFKNIGDINRFIRSINCCNDDIDDEVYFCIDDDGMRYIALMERSPEDIIIPGMINNKKVKLSDLGSCPNQLSFRKNVLYYIEEYKSEE